MTVQIANYFEELDQAARLDRIAQADPEIVETRLMNGMRCIFAIAPEQATHAHISLCLDAGSRCEHPGEHGTLHFFEHLLPSVYRVHHGGTDLGEVMEKRGWDELTAINSERLLFGFYGPDFDTAYALNLLLEITSYPAQDLGKVFEVEKGRIISEIRKDSKNPSKQEYQEVRKLLMMGTGYTHAVAGTQAEVAQYTLDDILRIGYRLLTNERATLVVSGRESVVQMAQDSFSRLQLAGSTPTDLELPPITPQREWAEIPSITCFPSPLVTDLRVSAFIPDLPSSGSRESMVASFVVKTLNSMLNDKLSYSSGITYSAGASRLSFPGTNMLDVSFEVSRDKLEAALDKFMLCLQTVHQEFTPELIEEEFSQTVSRAYLLVNTFNFGPFLEDIAAKEYLHHCSDLERLAVIQSLTPEEITRVAKTFLKPEKLKFFVTGPQEDLDRLPPFPNS